MVQIQLLQLANTGAGEQRRGPAVVQGAKREVEDADTLDDGRLGDDGGDLIGDLTVAQAEVAQSGEERAGQ